MVEAQPSPGGMPKRMRFKLVSNGERIKFYFDENVGGSFLCYTKVLEDILRRGRLEGYADFVDDRPEWKKAD